MTRIGRGKANSSINSMERLGAVSPRASGCLHGAIEQFVGDSLDAWPHGLDLPVGEAGLNQFAQASVIGRIDVEQILLEDLELFRRLRYRRELLLGHGVAMIDHDAIIQERFAAVVVARDQVGRCGEKPRPCPRPLPLLG